jgi:hypothetical protein
MNRHERRKARREERHSIHVMPEPGQDIPEGMQPPKVEIVFCDDDNGNPACYFVCNGDRVAKRVNGCWVPLVPGFSALSDIDEPQGSA